jgi:type II secretory pathway pseudopilin PulG
MHNASGGFTILETMIVIVVSAIIGLGGLQLVSGRTGETEFQIGINNFKQQLGSMINKAADGYANNDNSYSCDGSTVPVQIKPYVSGANGQGQNYGCILLGDVIQLAPQNEPSQFTTYPIIGNENYDSDIAQTVAESDPIPIAPYYSSLTHAIIDSGVNLSDTQTLGGGLTVHSVSINGAATPSISGIGFLVGDSNGTIASETENNLNSGRQIITLYYVKNSTLDEAPTSFGGQIATPNAANLTVVDSSSNVEVCLSGDNRSALLTIAGGSSLAVSVMPYTDVTC